MSPASYLTAPPRDAASIVAPSASRNIRWLRCRMSLLAWVSLVFLVVALVGVDRRRGPARAARPWRTFRSLLQRADGPAVDDVLRRRPRGRASTRSRSPTGTEQLTRRDARASQASLARLAVLRAAAAETSARCSPRLAAQRRAAEVMRVAAIDLGTNATRLLVADVDDGRVDRGRPAHRITRLGEGVDARRRLLPLPIARVRNTLTDYRRELESLGAERTLAVATSAVRDAENGEAFLGEVEWSYGFATRLLTGDEEAALTLRGVGPLEPGTVVVDVGGGSTELITDGLPHEHGHRLRAADRALTATHSGRRGRRTSARSFRRSRVERALGVDGTTAELAALAGCDTVTLDDDRRDARLARRLDRGGAARAAARARPQRGARRRRADPARDAATPGPRLDHGERRATC